MIGHCARAARRCSADFSGSEAIDLILAERVVRTPPCHRADELQLDGVD